jgi:hypothetical protein
MTIPFERIWTDVEGSKIDSMTIFGYETYILAFLFYRYQAENQARNLDQNDILEKTRGVSINDAYATKTREDILRDYLNDCLKSWLCNYSQ